ncbi:MAG TPA: hypothetical protein VNB87_10115 [Propionibacteriaceae bacterium]|nr:hypothetical protein [Propionibacteriaceae bacterium]
MRSPAGADTDGMRPVLRPVLVGRELIHSRPISPPHDLAVHEGGGQATSTGTAERIQPSIVTANNRPD